MRLLLDEVVSKNYSSKKASTVEEWKELVMEPLSRSEGPFTGNIVIVIDALGESGIGRLFFGFLLPTMQNFQLISGFF